VGGGAQEAALAAGFDPPSGAHFQYVDFAAVGPGNAGVPGSQEPEGRPEAVGGPGDFNADVQTAVLKAEFSHGIHPAGGDGLPPGRKGGADQYTKQRRRFNHFYEGFHSFNPIGKHKALIRVRQAAVFRPAHGNQRVTLTLLSG
jgi:hypothetical protein